MSSRCLSAFAGTAALILVGCGSSGSQSYYPLDTGHVWKYRAYLNTDGKETPVALTVSILPSREFNGASAYPRKYDIDLANQPTQTSIEFYTADDHAVCLRGEQKPGASDPVDYQQTRCILKFPLKQDFNWDEAVDKSLTNDENVVVTARIASTDETVTVPAGTFAHCVRVSTLTDQRINVPGIMGPTQAIIHISIDRWYAKGVGLVKSNEQSAIHGNIYISPSFRSKSVSMELAEFK